MARAEVTNGIAELERHAVTKVEAAKMLSASVSTIYRLLQSGELRGMRLGIGRMGKVVIAVEEIEALKQRRSAEFVPKRAR